MSFDRERRHASEYDQNPSCKASVPKECVDHECDSSLKPNPGIDADGTAETEADHFTKCPVAANSFDMCDLGADDPARPRRGTPIIAPE